MTLYEKLFQIYPGLTPDDLYPFGGTIEISNNSDGQGDYISKWEHPTLQRPTDEQLAEIN